ncbi:hypothetical protein [Vibrio owensii]|uniref:hypothetical protein n=1 Tax=Vibrio owensii TaxID=696485 RepID=UPI003CC505A8
MKITERQYIENLAKFSKAGSSAYQISEALIMHFSRKDRFRWILSSGILKRLVKVNLDTKEFAMVSSDHFAELRSQKEVIDCVFSLLVRVGAVKRTLYVADVAEERCLFPEEQHERLLKLLAESPSTEKIQHPELNKFISISELCVEHVVNIIGLENNNE